MPLLAIALGYLNSKRHDEEEMTHRKNGSSDSEQREAGV